MKILKSSWHYRFYERSFGDYHVHHRTNLCHYTHCVLYGMFLYAIQPLMWLMKLLLTIIGIPIMLLSGSYPVGIWKMKRYSPFVVKNTEFYPLHIVTPLLTLAMIVFLVSQKNEMTAFFFITAFIFAILLIHSLLMSGPFNGYHDTFIIPRRRQLEEPDLDDKVWTPSTIELVIEYVKAKKQKVCPLVTFDE